jgi:hypothetical protein
VQLSQTSKSVIFFLLQNQRTGGQKRSFWGVGTSGSEEEVGKGCGGLIWCKYRLHMHANGKMRPVEIIPGMGE